MGHRLLRGACTTCYASFRLDANLFRFCGNTPLSIYDSLGLVTEQDCDDQYDKAMTAAKKAASKCVRSAITWGLVGEIILGGGGAAGGGVVGGPPGAGIGFVCGTGLNAIIDLLHISHCMDKVNKMKKAAKDAYDKCMKQVEE